MQGVKVNVLFFHHKLVHDKANIEDLWLRDAVPNDALEDLEVAHSQFSEGADRFSQRASQAELSVRPPHKTTNIAKKLLRRRTSNP